MRAAPTGIIDGHSITCPSSILSLDTRGRWLWAELCPPKICMLTSLCPAPQNVTIFGNRIFKEVMKSKYGHWGEP